MTNTGTSVSGGKKTICACGGFRCDARLLSWKSKSLLLLVCPEEEVMTSLLYSRVFAVR